MQEQYIKYTEKTAGNNKNSKYNTKNQAYIFNKLINEEAYNWIWKFTKSKSSDIESWMMH